MKLKWAGIFRAALAGAMACSAAGVAGCGGSSGSGASGNGGGGQINTGPAITVFVVQTPVIGSGSNAAGSVLAFPATSSGSVSPGSTISPGTTLESVATDEYGNIYVSNGGVILEYAAGASGNPMPLREIAGSAAINSSVDGMAVSATGEIVVGLDSGQVNVFSATQNGNVAPERIMLGYSETGGGLSPVVVANQVALDSTGNIYVANLGQSFLGGPSIAVYGPTANGNAAPAWSLGTYSTLFPNGLTTDSAGNIYVTSTTCNSMTQVCAGTIAEYAAGASGSAVPIRTISGSATQLGFVYGIKVDAVGNIFVVSVANDASPTSPKVLKFSSTASGNVAPASSFSSPAWTSADFNPSLALY